MQENFKNPKKTFEITSSSEGDAVQTACDYFHISDPELLKIEVLKKEGIFFGIVGKRKQYRFSIKPNYELLAREFLTKCIRMAHLDLDYHSSYENKLLAIELDGEDAELLTANNGELLSSFEHLVKKWMAQLVDFEEDFQLIIDSNNFKEEKLQQLKALAQKMKAKVLAHQTFAVLPPLAPADRRIIHQFLDGDTRIMTASLGNGFYKKIKISLKNGQRRKRRTPSYASGGR